MNEPKLRFKADDGSEFPEWEKQCFGNIMSSMEYGMNAAAMKFDGTHKYLRITDIDDETRRYSTTDVVSPSGKLDDKYLVKTGDMFFTRTGASVGKTYLYDNRDGIMYFAGFLIRGRIKSEYDPYYVYVQTLTAQYEEWVKIMSIRSGQPGINANEYASYKFLCTTDKREQQKIGALFYTVDSVIENIQTEIKAWEKQKRGVMQLLFSRKVRFKADDGSEFPEWEEKKLGEVFNERVERSNGTEELLAVTIAKGVTKHSDSNKRNTASNDTSNYKVVYKGDLAYNTMRMWQGAEGASDYHGIISPAYTVLICNDNNDVKFFEYMFKQTCMLHQFEKHSQGLTSDTWNLKYNNFSQINVVVPSSLYEQQKIAACLSGFDDVIDKAKKELEAYRELKKGLLQQMFV